MSDDLRDLVSTLEQASGAVAKDVAAVVKKGAQNVKEQMVRDSSGISHAPHFPGSISYDVEGDGRFGAVEAVIGPDKNRTQGALGNILAFGTSRNAPVFSIMNGLDQEAPRFEKALADLAAKALE